jgi:hypothetical protein
MKRPSSLSIRIGFLATSLVFSGASAQATPLAVTAAGDPIYVVDGGALVDLSGAPTSSPVGTAAAVAANPQNGHVFAWGASSTVWEHDGVAWSPFADLSGLGVSGDTSSDLAISANGTLAFVDSLDRIYLMDQTGALIDASGAPTSSHVGVSPAVDWSTTTGNLIAFGGTTVWENDGLAWNTIADLSS